MSTSDAVQKQWDVGSTAIASTQKLLELIGAVSEDNVQAQAVLAFCALGTVIRPTPELIGSAVDALGGTKNVKLQNLKLAIGLKMDGTASYLRQSSPGIATFLLTCALKLWYTDDNIGNILHQIAVRSGVVSHYPTSPQQFCRIIDAVSGHAGRILPVGHLSRIGSAILDAGVDTSVMQVLYKVISNEAIADILILALSGLHNSEVKLMSLKGAMSAIWIIALLTWLIPDDVCVIAAGRLVVGPERARLLIDLGLPDNDENVWEFVEWKKELSLRNLISAGDFLINELYLSRLMTRQRLQCLYKLSSAQVVIFGQFAGAILCYFVENGTIFHQDIGQCIRDNGERYEPVIGKTPVTTLLDVAGTWFRDAFPNLMQEYGWTIDDLCPGQQELCDILRGWEGQPQDDSRTVQSSFEEYLVKLAITLHGPFLDFTALKDCMNYAIAIASDALIFITRDSAASWEGIKALGTSIEEHHESEIVARILHKVPFSIGLLRSTILERLCPYKPSTNTDIVIASSSGCVIYPSFVLEPSLRQESALALNIELGTIRRGLERFSVVREVRAEPGDKIDSTGTVQLFVGDNFVRPVPTTTDQQVDLEVLSSISGTTLMIKSVMIFQMSTPVTSGKGAGSVQRPAQSFKVTRDFSWIQAMMALAVAKHMASDDMITLREEEALARSLASNQPETLAMLQWILPSSGRPAQPRPREPTRKLVARTCRDLMASLYQISLAEVFPVIQNGVSLVKCVAVAEEMADEWVIIT